MTIEDDSLRLSETLEAISRDRLGENVPLDGDAHVEWLRGLNAQVRAALAAFGDESRIGVEFIFDRYALTATLYLSEASSGRSLGSVDAVVRVLNGMAL